MRNPDGSGFALALMPFATVPTGNSAIGAGDWGAGLLLPITRELPAGLQFGFTGSSEVTVDEDGVGHHLAHGAIVGLDVPLGETVEATFELSARRDRDPSGAATEWLGGMSVTWSPNELLQLDVGANPGLEDDSPDLQLYFGVAHRF